MGKELPNNWVDCTLGDLLTLRNGYAFKSNEYKTDGIPVIRISDIQQGEVNAEHAVYVDENESFERFVIESGDVLVAMSGATTGKYGVYTSAEKAYQNQRVGNFKPYSDELFPRSFIYYLLGGLKKEIEDQAYGGAQPNISSKLIESLPVSIPPLPEQQRIVAKLDSLFAHLEEVKTRLELVPELLKQFRQSVLTQAVTGKLTEEWRNINKLPEWGKIKLEKVGVWSGGGTPSKAKKEFWTEGSIPWITPKDMKGLKLNDSMDKVTAEAVDNSSAKMIESGSILIVTRSGILRRILPVSMNVVTTTVNQDIKAITPSDDFEGDFVLYTLIGLEEDIRNTCMKSGTTVESVETNLLKEYSIGHPSKEEQTEIVRRVESLLSKADVIEAKYKQLKTQIDNLPQALLAKAFKGELVEQLESDGDARELLRSIERSRKEEMGRVKKK